MSDSNKDTSVTKKTRILQVVVATIGGVLIILGSLMALEGLGSANSSNSSSVNHDSDF